MFDEESEKQVKSVLDFPKYTKHDTDTYWMALSAVIHAADDPRAFTDYVNREVVGKAKLGFEWDDLGFFADYFWLARLIPTYMTVVDVGCATGLQHTLFRNHKKYIGIEREDMIPIRAFTQNAEFIRGDFLSLLDRLDAELDIKNTFGIDNMALWYSRHKDDWREEIDKFNVFFMHKFQR